MLNGRNYGTEKTAILCIQDQDLKISFKQFIKLKKLKPKIFAFHFILKYKMQPFTENQNRARFVLNKPPGCLIPEMVPYFERF